MRKNGENWLENHKNLNKTITSWIIYIFYDTYFGYVSEDDDNKVEEQEEAVEENKNKRKMGKTHIIIRDIAQPV